MKRIMCKVIITHILLLMVNISVFALTYEYDLNYVSEGTISVTGSQYSDESIIYWNINGTQNTKPLRLDYEVDIENNHDWLYIYAVDSDGVAYRILTLTGQASGSISTVFPTGRAKIEFRADGSANGTVYDGFTLSYAPDNLISDYTVNNKLLATNGIGIGTGVLGSEGLCIYRPNAQYGIKSAIKSTSRTSYGLYSSMSNTGNSINVYGIYSSVSSVTGKCWAGYFTGGDVEIDNGDLRVSGNIGANKTFSFRDTAHFTVTNSQIPTLASSFSMPHYGIASPNVGGSAELWLSGNNGIRLFTNKNAMPKLTINTDGKVGIGTSTPTQQLDVEINADYQLRLGNTSGMGYNIGRNITTGYLNFYGDQSGYNGYVFGGVNGTFMTIKNDGKVGIGVTNPDEALTVNGIIRAREVKIDNANWPDYVFAKNYQLPSLSEVSKHIEEKKHLPGVPSAKEVEENGISLSEMNATLLQKIEELTLYMIQQEKRIEMLEQQFNHQK